MKVPQANDVSKLLDIPLAVVNGENTPSAVSKRYRIVYREAQYYLDAAEILGFLDKRNTEYSLSSIGQKYVEQNYQERKDLLVRQMLVLPIIQTVLVELVVRRQHSLTLADLREIIKTKARLTGTTVPRRASTVFRWFKWLGGETGAFKTRGSQLWIGIG